jgi:hypothetical protein
MKTDRRQFLKTMAVVPLLGAASAFTFEPMQGKYYLRLVLEGPFGLIVSANRISAWTPAFQNHVYMGGQTLLSKPPYRFSFKEAPPAQSALQLDAIFKDFELRKVKAPGKSAMAFTLPLPVDIKVGCYRKVRAVRGGKILDPQKMPANFILTYEITEAQHNDRKRLALVDPQVSILPVIPGGKSDLELVMQAGVPQGQGSEAHAIAVMKKLVADTGSPAIALEVQKIHDREPICDVPTPGKTPGMMMYFATDVDCTAGGLPGCDDHPYCS